uniref:Uncharacterized protein n=1 Tax=Rhizophora mucronata TaxID=61149 RepID=A0A2P2PH07_RHIMU
MTIHYLGFLFFVIKVTLIFHSINICVVNFCNCM